METLKYILALAIFMVDFACKSISIDEVIKCSLGLTRAELDMFHFLLDNSSEQFTSEDIALKLKLDLTTIQRSVKKLTERGVLLRNQENMDGGGYFFVYELKSKPELKKIFMNNIHGWISRVEASLDGL